MYDLLDIARYNIASCPNDALALSNRLVVNANDFAEDVDYVKLKGRYVLGIM